MWRSDGTRSRGRPLSAVALDGSGCVGSRNIAAVLAPARRGGTGMRRRGMGTRGRSLVYWHPVSFLGLVLLTLSELPAAAVGATT
jgi:hypothetical protein